VLTNSKGFTLYSFAPDTPAKSNCNGTCAQNWPPVQGPATASGVTGTFGTIKRSDGSAQATFDGHPLYAFVGDTAPGQAKGNGLNAAGGLWHEITTSGTAPPAAPHRAPAAEATGTEPDSAGPGQTGTTTNGLTAMTRQETTTGQTEMTAAAQASTRNRRDPAGGRSCCGWPVRPADRRPATICQLRWALQRIRARLSPAGRWRYGPPADKQLSARFTTSSDSRAPC